MAERVSRRLFLGAVASSPLVVGAATGGADTRAAELPKRPLGKTGERVPILGLGTAPAGHRGRREAARFFEYAVECGVTYLDTAPAFAGYGEAQLAVGDVIRGIREQVFVVTKCWEPDGEAALRLLQRNMRELRVDYVDLVYAHSLGSDRMPPERVLAPNGVLAALEKARRDGLIRYVGISGHNRPDRFVRVLNEFPVDVMMTAVNFVIRHVYNFEERVWPVARQKGVGLVAMKVFGGIDRRVPGAKGARARGENLRLALKYAYSLEGLSTAVIGCYDRHELDQVLSWIREGLELTPEEAAYLERRGKALAADWGELYGPVV